MARRDRFAQSPRDGSVAGSPGDEQNAVVYPYYPLARAATTCGATRVLIRSPANTPRHGRRDRGRRPAPNGPQRLGCCAAGLTAGAIRHAAWQAQSRSSALSKRVAALRRARTALDERRDSSPSTPCAGAAVPLCAQGLRACSLPLHPGTGPLRATIGHLKTATLAERSSPTHCSMHTARSQPRTPVSAVAPHSGECPWAAKAARRVRHRDVPRDSSLNAPAGC
jgi:hypothetical protein